MLAQHDKHVRMFQEVIAADVQVDIDFTTQGVMVNFKKFLLISKSIKAKNS